jgi:hypothetical protein
MTESTVQFGSEGRLVGTFTEPDTPSGRPSSVAVLLTNAGVLSRSGPHRINVHLARRFAAMGLPSLRWDGSGLGDSERPSGALPMREQLIADTRVAMDEAQRRYAVSRFVMIGFCSGAEAAYYTALQDERLVGVVLFDLFTYPTWKTQLLRINSRIRRYGLLSALRRLFMALIRTVFRPRLQRSPSAGQSPAAIPSRAEFAARLRTLAERGTRVLVLHSAESELQAYEGQFRDGFRGFGILDKVDYSYLRKCDHVLTTPEGQRSFVSAAIEWVQSLETTHPKRGEGQR